MWIMQWSLASHGFRVSPHQTPSWRQGRRPWCHCMFALYVFLTPRASFLWNSLALRGRSPSTVDFSGYFYHLSDASETHTAAYSLGKWILDYTDERTRGGTSLAVHWLQFPMQEARVWSLVRELRVLRSQLKIPYAATKTQCIQINNILKENTREKDVLNA